MLCSGDMFKLYYRLVFVESSRLSWSTKVLTEAKNLGTFHIFKNSAILRKCFYGFKLSSPVSPREPMTCADVIQLCRLNRHCKICQRICCVVKPILFYENRGRVIIFAALFRLFLREKFAFFLRYAN